MKFNQIIPELLVSDIDKSLSFYVKVVGFRIEYSRPENHFYFLSLKKCQIMLFQDVNGQTKKNKEKWITSDLAYPRGRGVNFQIEINNTERILKSIEDEGYEIYLGIREKWRRVGKREIGEMEFLVQDPDGYLLRFSETIGVRKIKKDEEKEKY